MQVPLVFTDSSARDTIRIYAERFNLSPALVAAIVMQESGGHPGAWNPEPRWRWFWDVKQNGPFRRLYPGEGEAEKPPSDFPCLAGDPDQEWWAQQASWGLMQIMGACARELGYKAPYLTELVDPFDGLNWGCKKFAQLQSRLGAGAISAYNAGSPMPGSKYEKSVLVWKDKLQPLFL